MSENNKSDIKSCLENILVDVAKAKNIKNPELKPNIDVQIGDGFVAHFYTGEIRDRESGDITHVAIKKAPTFEWDFSNIFKNEIVFYTSILPALSAIQKEVILPEPFDNTAEFFSFGMEPRKEYITMENLKNKGYVLFDKKKYLNKEHLEFIFRIYGKFHALSFVLRKQNFKHYQEIHREYTDVFDMFTEYANKQFEDSLSAAIEGLDPKSKVFEEAKDLPRNIKATMLKEMTYSGQYRCSTHGDCWSNNMLFKYSDDGKLEDIKLIDFQLARDSSPIHDISYFFYSGACKNDLDALEDYLKIYHNTMSEVIKKFGEDPDELFSYDNLINEWKENALLGVFMGIYVWQIKLVNKEECASALKNIENIEEMTDSFNQLFSSTHKSDDFKERTAALLTHAYEFGVLRKDKIVMTDTETASSEGLLQTEL